MNEPAQFLGDLKKADPDRYLAALYTPAAKRNDLTILYAFNAEIAAIRDRIRDALPGEVRLQWWRDFIASGKAEAAGGHPLATALLGVIDRNGLPVSAFQNYLDARVFDLYNDPMPSRGDLEGYLGETASMIIQLSCLVLHRDDAQAVAGTAGHAGCAQGIAGLLQLLPLHRARGQCYVPGDILASAGSSVEEFLAGSSASASERVVQAMVALGREHWAASASVSVPASVRPAFLAATATPDVLDAAAKAGASAITKPLRISPLWRFWRYFRTSVA